jgi:hypothetical protein
MILEKYGDNFSDQPLKKVHMSESVGKSGKDIVVSPT